MLEKLPDAIGHVLHDLRAGLDQIVFNAIGLRAGMGSIRVASLAFADHAPIPQRYTSDGEGISPPIDWMDLPPETACVVLLVEDADSPTPHPLVHAIVIDLPASDHSLRDGAMPSADREGDDGLRMGRNSYLQTAWLPPDPPPGHGVHRYAFEVFALREGEDFSESPGRDELIDRLRERAIASGLLIGTYERHDGSIPDRESRAVPAGLMPAAG